MNHETTLAAKAGGVRLRAWQHTSLAVSDLDKAIQFYRSAFGFICVFVVRGMEKQIARISGIDGLRCDLAQLTLPAEEQTSNHSSAHLLELIAFHLPAHVPGSLDGNPVLRGHISFTVQNLEEAIDCVVRHGAVLLGSITEFEEGRAIYCQEPAGSVIELEEYSDATNIRQEAHD